MNIECYWDKNRLFVLCNIIEGPDINLHIQTSNFLIKKAVIYTRKITVSSTTNAGCQHAEQSK